jgi:RNA polymerase sigma-70 factor (ECF subfamily)
MDHGHDGGTVMTTPSSTKVADAVLVQAARSGDLFAWERLVRRHQESVYRVAFIIVRDTALAEDATKSTFVRAYRALPSYEESVGLVPGLLRIAAGEARQQRRESGRARQGSRPVERINGPRYPASVVPGTEQAGVLDPAQREAVSEAFERLGEEDRLTLAYRYLLGMSRAEAAQALSIGSALADEHLRTALDHLRGRVAEA